MVELRGRIYNDSCGSKGEKEVKKKLSSTTEWELAWKRGETRSLNVALVFYLFFVPVTSESLHIEQ